MGYQKMMSVNGIDERIGCLNVELFYLRELVDSEGDLPAPTEELRTELADMIENRVNEVNALIRAKEIYLSENMVRVEW